MTSHWPLKVPPQGPFRICLGQVCGQTYCRSGITQLPHSWQPKAGDLTTNSARASECDSDGLRSIQVMTPLAILCNIDPSGTCFGESRCQNAFAAREPKLRGGSGGAVLFSYM